MTTIARKMFSVSEVELIYRNNVPFAERIKITSAATAYDVLLSAWDMTKIELVEHSYVVLLDRAGSVLGMSHVATGGVTGCVIDPKIVFCMALKANACSIMLAHNHPSGSLNPSRADLDLTARLAEGGKILDIRLLDHLIVTSQSYYSFAEQGLLP